MTSPTLPSGTVLAGRYQVEGLLGDVGHADRGGWSEVYRARDLNPRMQGQQVVVKFPKRDLAKDADFARRFESEIEKQVRARNRHSHVVPILDAGEHEGRTYCVLEYMEGGSLESRMVSRTRGPDGTETRVAHRLTAAEVAAWLPAIASAVDAVHRQGVVHRDIKPANILFSAGGEAYLSDFGIAKAATAGGPETPTPPGFSFYTPGYESPEMARGKKAVFACDRYALAVVVYRALSTRLPHWPEGGAADYESPLHALRDRRREAPPTDVRRLEPQVSAAVARVVMKALDPDEARRFRSCEAFSAAFTAAVEGRDVEGRGSAGGAGAPTPPAPIGPARDAPGPRVEDAGRRDALVDDDGDDDADEGRDERIADAEAGGLERSSSPARRRWSAARLALALLVVGGAVAWAVGAIGSRRTPPASVEDVLAPTLTVDPSGDVETSVGVVTFQGRATDAHLKEVLVDGREVVRFTGPDGVFAYEVRLEPGQQRTISFVALDRAGNRSEPVERTVRRAARDPAWRGPLAAAQASGQATPPDWKAAATHYAEAVAAGLPAGDVPKWLEDGVRRWQAPATVAIETPSDGAAATEPEATVTIRVTTLRDDDTVRIAEKEVRKGGGAASARVPLAEGETEIVAEVRDVAGDPRARATVKVRWSRAAVLLAGWAEPQGADVDAATGLPRKIRRTRDGMTMILVPAGTFRMGEPGKDKDGKPTSVEVTLTEPYYLDEHEVTVAQFAAFVAATKYVTEGEACPIPRDVAPDVRDGPVEYWTPTWRNGEPARPTVLAPQDAPVVGLAWADAVAYANWANVSLPTEAQWERAARGEGPPSRYAWGEAPTPDRPTANLDDGIDRTTNAAFEDGIKGALAAVKSFPPNERGIYDLIGNAPEWCLDVAVSDLGALGDRTNPRGPPLGFTHALRGGSWATAPSAATIGARETVVGWGHFDRAAGGVRCAAPLRAEGGAWRRDDRRPTDLAASLDLLAAGLTDPASLQKVPSELDRLEAGLRIATESEGVDERSLEGLEDLRRGWSMLTRGEPITQQTGGWRLVAVHPPKSPLGRPAAEVFRSVSGGGPAAIDWAGLRGKVGVYATWANWCGTCDALDADLRASLRRVNRPSEVWTWIEHFARGVEEPALERERARASARLRASGLRPSRSTEVRMGGGAPSGVRDLGFSTIHATAVIGRDGRVVAVGMQGPLLEFAIRYALAQPTPPPLPPKPAWAKTSPEQDAFAAQAGLPVAVEGAIGMRFVLIPPGSSRVGTPSGVPMPTWGRPSEVATVADGYYLAVTEVTNAQYRKFRPSRRLGRITHPSAARPAEAVIGDLDGPDQPVVGVEYEDAVAFCAWLNSQSAEWVHDLPSENEWERAAAAGVDVPPDWGGEPATVGRFGSFAVRGKSVDFSSFRTAAVGSYPPNRFGLFDLAGNACEWTSTQAEADPTGARITKGGGFLWESSMGGDGYWGRRPGYFQECGIRVRATPKSK